MQHLIKECPALVKAAPGAQEDQGQFTAIVSVFGNEDSVGDVVMPGAFTQTLADWKASGNPIPVIWSHDWADPFSHIGYTLDAEEIDAGDDRLPDDLKNNGGLLVTGQIDMDNPKAVQVYRLLKGNRVTQFSFAYDIEEGALVDNGDEMHYELRILKLFEVGPCLVGANQETELLAVKASNLAAGLKEGRVLAAKHVSKLKDAHAAIGEVIATAEKVDDDAKAHAAEETKSSADEAEAGLQPGTDQDASRPGSEQQAAAEQAAAPAGKSGAANGVNPERVRMLADLDAIEFGLAATN